MFQKAIVEVTQLRYVVSNDSLFPYTETLSKQTIFQKAIIEVTRVPEGVYMILGVKLG